MVLGEPAESHADACGDTTTVAHRNRLPPPGIDAPAPRAAKASDEVLTTGTVLGRYLVLDQLGAGGSGAVYRAYDPQLERRVAVKVLHASGGIAEMGRRRELMLREGQAMARLSHPNVVPVYDVGSCGDDLFVAMELVEGQSLSKWLTTRRDWKQVRGVFVQAGAGLAAAHRAGLVHRDFKPGNVLLALDASGRVERVLVADFGLARSAGGPPSGADLPVEARSPIESTSARLLTSELTEQGVVKGTPPYMAPELLEGQGVGPATDQFAFCVSMWRGLYQAWPFPPLPDHGAGRDRVLQQPSDRRGTPGWLHAALERGLSLQAQARFATMDALLHALQRDLRSRRRIWIGVAVAAALSVGSAGVGAVFFRPPPTAAQLSETEQLVLEARAVAAQAYFVYPDPDDPEGATAYKKVLALEALDDADDRGATQDAAGLREEFAETLVRLGDDFYARDGGRPFAADYYAAALVFVPDLERARERTTLTPGEVADLRDKSSAGTWSDAELAAGAALAALAAPDPEARIDRLRALGGRRGAVAASTSARMRPLLSKAERAVLDEPIPGAPAAPEPDAKDLSADEAGTDPPQPVPEDEVDDDPAPDASGSSRADRGKSATQAGLTALREQRFDDAQRLLGQAVAQDRRNARALAGLAELHFERGSYRKAVDFGERAVKRSPRNGGYRILLGDAYFKTLAFNGARRQYERARELGHPKAKARLRQLGTEMGN